MKAVTAEAVADQAVQKSLEVGFAAHLIKPVNFDQLNRTIAAVLGPFTPEIQP
jgi:response regulator of citrate/malate metabolism